MMMSGCHYAASAGYRKLTACHSWCPVAPAYTVVLTSIVRSRIWGRGWTTMRSEFEPIIRLMRLMAAERAELSKSGPRFIVLHRFWKPETLCTPGEAIAEIRFHYCRKEVSVPLS